MERTKNTNSSLGLYMKGSVVKRSKWFVIRIKHFVFVYQLKYMEQEDKEQVLAPTQEYQILQHTYLSLVNKE